MNSRPVDCLCAGIVVADHICAPVDHVPRAGELVTTDRLELTIGGCAANVAVDLAKLRKRAAIAGLVGKDVFGQFVRQTLEDAGVDCEHLLTSATSQTSGTLIVNVRGEDRRFIHTTGANAEFSGRGIPRKLIENCRVLYLGGYCLSDQPSAETVAEIFEAARRAGVRTVLDVVIPGPADYWPHLRPVLPHTDVFLPNNDEAQIITGETDPLRQAEMLHEAGAATVVVTCGKDGAILVGRDRSLRSGCYPVEFLDGTGSGDAFVAGYIYGLLEGGDEATCLRYGSVLGASCVRATGATAGVLTADELPRYIESEPLAVEVI